MSGIVTLDIFYYCIVRNEYSKRKKMIPGTPERDYSRLFVRHCATNTRHLYEYENLYKKNGKSVL